MAMIRLPAYEVPANAMWNFKPVNEGIESYQRGAEQTRQFNARREIGNAMAGGQYNQAADVAAREGELDTSLGIKKFGMDQQKAESEQRKQLVQQMGGTAQRLLRLPADQQGPEFQKYLQSQPGLAENLTKHGVPVNDARASLQFIYDQARGYKDEDETAKMQAQTGLIGAQTRQADAHARYYDAQGREGGLTKPPSGFEWVDAADRSKGLRAIPGGPGEHISSEVAGRMALMETAMPGVKAAREVFLREWGPGDVGKNVASRIPGVGDAAWASGDVGIARRSVRTAIEAALRVMTGAAAPESEVVRYESMFMPGVNDTRESAKQKLDQLETFMGSAKEIALRGRTSNPQSTQSQATQSQAGGAPRIQSEADYNALPSGTRYIDPQGNTRVKQ